LSGFALQPLVGAWGAVQALVQAGAPREGFVGLTVGLAALPTFSNDILRRIHYRRGKSVIVVNESSKLSIQTEKFLVGESAIELASGLVFLSNGLETAKLRDFAEKNEVKTTRVSGNREREVSGIPAVYLGVPVGDIGAPRELALIADVEEYFRFMKLLAVNFADLL
jgi:hypothetical protein